MDGLILRRPAICCSKGMATILKHGVGNFVQHGPHLHQAFISDIPVEFATYLGTGILKNGRYVKSPRFPFTEVPNIRDPTRFWEKVQTLWLWLWSLWSIVVMLCSNYSYWAPGKFCAQDENMVNNMHTQCGVARHELPISVKFLPSKDWMIPFLEEINPIPFINLHPNIKPPPQNIHKW